MKPPRPETYIMIGNMAYNFDNLPWHKRWKIRVKRLLGIRIDAL
jgi:hypothetical protein